MHTLHIIRQSAFNTSDLTQCLSIINDNDALVLIDDGCYNLKHPILQPYLETKQSSLRIYIVEEHSVARGMPTVKTVPLISMAKVVEFTFAYQQVITWQ